eukprot:c22604_g1_i1 orf=251-751(-)
MDELPSELCLRVFSMLDYRHLASAALVCRSWSNQSGQAHLWQRLYEQRWGKGASNPCKFKSWKAAYEARDRCERVGMDISITREGFDYFLVHEGRLLRLLGSCKSQKQGLDDIVCGVGEKQSIHIPAALPLQEKNTVSQEGLVDKLFFFLGDLEYATRKPKRTRVC